MRRKDKEIKDKAEIESIIKRATVCRIGLSENNMPYIVPVNFGYRDNCLYVHSSFEGKKIDIIKKNNNICFEIDIDVGLIEGKIPCKSSVKYYSVIGFGKAFLIEDSKEKQRALNTIVEHHFNNKSIDYLKNQIGKIVIIKIEIEYMTGKKSGY